MSDDIGEGLSDAMWGAIEGAILSCLFSVFSEVVVTLPDVPSYAIGIFQLLGVVLLVGSMLVVPKMKLWRIAYLIGWLLGTWIMYTAGLVESWLLVVYVIVGILAFIGKIFRTRK
jgi:hypothetical protein